MMDRYAPLVGIVLLCALSSGCGSSSPTIPTSGGTGSYAGDWMGTTTQGRPIMFSVSADQKVTAINVGYSFNGCTGTRIFSNLALDIGNPPNPATSLGPGFGYGSPAPDSPNYTQIYGSFTSSTTATGSVVFGAYTDCGNSGAVWTAAKR
jgi:hypothetical protein